MNHRYRRLPIALIAALALWTGASHGGNVVCDPDICAFTSDSPARTVDVVYQGGASGLLYGYSILISWDGSVIAAGHGDVAEGSLLSAAGDSWFETSPAGTDSIVVDCALLGAHPGVAGPGVLFSVAFTGLACNMTDLNLTILAARDGANNPLSGLSADDGLCIVDMVDPVFTVAGPYPDGLCQGAAPVLSLSVSDACGDLDDAWYRIDSGDWFGDAGLFANHSGNAWANPAWTLPGFDALSEGPHTIGFRCTDDIGNDSNEPSWSFIKDTVPPPPVTDFLALPGNGKVHLTWTDPVDDFDHVVVLRRPWNGAADLGYPEYPLPADGYPADPSDGVVVYDGAGEAFDDSVAERSVYFYRAFVYDCAGHWSGGAPPAGPVPDPFPQGDRSTDYWLGDVTGLLDGGADGLVDFWDFNALSRCYRVYSTGNPPPPPHNELDVGITDDGTRFGIPYPNDQINVEEVLMLRANFNRVGPAGKRSPPVLAPRRREPGEAAALRPRPVEGARKRGAAAARVSAVPEIFIDPVCSGVDLGDVFDVRILIDSPDDSPTNFQAFLSFDPDMVELVDVFQGELYADLDTVTVRQMVHAGEESTGVWEVFDVILSPGAVVERQGELAAFRFRALAEGISPVRILAAYAMGEDRYLMDPLLTTDGLICVGEEAVGVEGPEAETRRWRLGAPSPNPFAGTTRFRVESPGGPSGAVLAVYDARGRLIRRLMDFVGGGVAEGVWDGRDDRGERVPSGVYFCKLRASDRTFTRKVIFLR